MTQGDKTGVPDAAEDRTLVIRDALRNAIIDRRLSPGAKLSEGEVGALFSVSRTVARAALQTLAFEGLVTTERNRGAFVAQPSPAEARQVFEARRLIEPSIVAAAVARVTAADIARFRRQIDDEQRHMDERGPAARRAEIKASGDFHLMIAEVAGNGILQRFMDELVARSSLVIALYGQSNASSCGHAEHAGIVAAFEAGDTDGAIARMIHHIDHIEADLDLGGKQGLGLRDALGLGGIAPADGAAELRDPAV